VAAEAVEYETAGDMGTGLGFRVEGWDDCECCELERRDRRLIHEVRREGM
jgi:hypothetical protein